MSIKFFFKMETCITLLAVLPFLPKRSTSYHTPFKDDLILICNKFISLVSEKRVTLMYFMCAP